MGTNGNAKRVAVASSSKGSRKQASSSPPADASPILYFSGCREWKGGIGEAQLHQDSGWRHRCFSYYYLGPAKDSKSEVGWDYCLKHPEIRVFLDSGAHSFLAGKALPSPKELEIYLDKYAEWAKPIQDRMDFVVNFDYIKRAPIIYDVLQGLKRRGLNAIPCYHGDSSLDWIRRYADEGYRLIGLGKPTSFVAGGKWLRARYYEGVFNLTEKLGVRCHGFAVTGSNLFHFPWHSVDSASWLRIAVRGAVLLYDPARRRLEVHHVAKDSISSTTREGVHRLHRHALAAIKERLACSGIPFSKLQASSYWRAVHNIKAQMSALAQKPETSLGMRGWTPVL